MTPNGLETSRGRRARDTQSLFLIATSENGDAHISLQERRSPPRERSEDSLPIYTCEFLHGLGVCTRPQRLLGPALSRRSDCLLTLEDEWPRQGAPVPFTMLHAPLGHDTSVSLK